eukprot:TRINITY_DN25045_c0_g1_i1.p1 TRINITY_DN25045_c0_g1~~TRINITY_DN25045_c0_g1_i1.p1  ORF type:complete len:212 (+),score=31.00 TRINITY_DN25045_c0_g1_i1:36-638(+)
MKNRTPVKELSENRPKRRRSSSSVDMVYLTVQRIRHRPVALILAGRKRSREERDEDYVPEPEEVDQDSSSSRVMPAPGTREHDYLSLCMNIAKESTGIQLDDEKDVSVLLDDNESTEVLLRNTALNSFLTKETVSEENIKRRITKIRNRELDHIQSTNIQKVMQALYEMGKLPTLNGMSASVSFGEDDLDMEDEDDEDFS